MRIAAFGGWEIACKMAREMEGPGMWGREEKRTVEYDETESYPCQ
jgi:hypothetical protein